MQITKVIINNFCNIVKAEYDLSKRNIFIGPNQKGKTNTLLAIYWALTGYCLDGSSDDMSLKPRYDTKKEVSVELIFDSGFSFKKVYFEKWTTKRGTKEVVMDGHMTDYYVNNDKYIASEAFKQLHKELGYNIELETSKFDLIRACVDPYYMAITCDWKLLRTFVIELVGDVKNEDVYMADESLLFIKPLLDTYNHDTAKATKHLKDRIKKTKEEIDSKEKGQKGFSDVQDVTAEELANAQANLEMIEKMIADYLVQKSSSVNQNLQLLQQQKSNLSLELSDSITHDTERLVEVNADINNTIANEKAVIDSLNEKVNQLRYEENKVKLEIMNHNQILSMKKNQFELKKKEAEDLRQGYVIENGKEFVPMNMPDATLCPHCGGVLNEELINQTKLLDESNRIRFEEMKSKKLHEITSKGKQAALDVQNLELEISELEGKILPDVAHFATDVQKLINEKSLHEQTLEKSKATLQTSFVSEHTADLRMQLERLNERIIEECKVNTTEEIDRKIAKCKESKSEPQKIIDSHSFYLNSQAQAKSIDIELDRLSTERMELETKQIMVEKFVQLKLSMLQSNVEKVFGTDIKFTLVESNIKEGSWNETCYPSVLGKDTPFKKGSESEKIIAGIYLAECVKKKMELPDLPILFDAGSELDTASLTTRLNTESQLVMTKVDDINYTNLTLINA